jgi:hypothetical protein
MDARTGVELERANQEPTGGSKEGAKQDEAHLVDLGLPPPPLPGSWNWNGKGKERIELDVFLQLLLLIFFRFFKCSRD